MRNDQIAFKHIQKSSYDTYIVRFVHILCNRNLNTQPFEQTSCELGLWAVFTGFDYFPRGG